MVSPSQYTYNFKFYRNESRIENQETITGDLHGSLSRLFCNPLRSQLSNGLISWQLRRVGMYALLNLIIVELKKSNKNAKIK